MSGVTDVYACTVVVGVVVAASGIKIVWDKGIFRAIVGLEILTGFIGIVLLLAEFRWQIMMLIILHTILTTYLLIRMRKSLPREERY